MPGLATRLIVADQVLAQLEAQNVAVDRPWFMFGALGPAIGDFVSAGGQAAPTPYLALWQQVLNLAVGTSNTGLIPTLQQLQTLLSNVESLVNSEDFEGLRALQSSGALNTITTLITQLTNAINLFRSPGQLDSLGSLIGTGPLINNRGNQFPPVTWTGREWLHWKRPGDFASRLLSDAQASGNSRFISYALGWQVAYATLVCGSDFVNSLVGSCYRSYWWRFRWISNFVDAWLWGFYNSHATLGEDGNPVFPGVPLGETNYASWPSLCNASLHEWIDVTGGALEGITAANAVVKNFNNNSVPLFTSGGTTGLLSQPLPEDFVDFWMKAWNNTYSSSPLFTPAGLQTGYLMTWLVLWFQTSGQVIGCLPSTSPAPPSASCDGSEYSLQKTAATPGQGSPFQLEPTPERDPDTATSVCGWITAILWAIFGGINPVAAFGSIDGGVKDVIWGQSQLNWGLLQCQMYWINVFMYNALSDLHKVAVLAGLQHPYASDLDISSSTSLAFGPWALSYLSSASTCRSSRPLRSMLQPWDGRLFPSLTPPLTATWTDYPKNGAPETPPTSTPPWEPGRRFQWPSAIVNDAERNPGNPASILNAPAAYNSGIPGTPASFGPAVPSALAIINAGSPVLPNWNLDGDRSLGWLTWQFVGPYSVPVKTKAES